MRHSAACAAESASPSAATTTTTTAAATFASPIVRANQGDNDRQEYFQCGFHRRHLRNYWITTQCREGESLPLLAFGISNGVPCSMEL
jgi:hypothetical protein